MCAAMLNVIVVGAGIAGLSAAISLRRAGHSVHVYERSSFNNEIGAAINIPPNATRFLTAWGLDPSRWRFVPARRITFIDPVTLKATVNMPADTMAMTVGGAALYYAHRVDLHNALKWLAVREDGPGSPVTIHLGSQVVGYDPSQPSIFLEGGKEVCGDIVVGADGVHSCAAETVMGHENQPVAPVHSNYCYRFLIPAATLDEDPGTRFWNEQRDGWTRLFVHNDTKRRMVVYPCRDNTIHNFVGLFFDEDMESDTREDWQEGVDISEVLARFSDFNPRLLKVMSKATHAKQWPLLYRHPLSTWRKGRLVLAGDSAHPMLPHQAQGGAQGLKDGLALGVTLHGASSPEEIEKRLEIYERIELLGDELRQYLRGDEIPTNPADIYKYNFGFDVVRAALAAMEEYDPKFRLPPDFFESEVPGIPT
ncbi:FAD binding domain-containing protein [Hirsutella rhossiliensis]|uniref:FAD binding domain-containing protein n=1 Tax=Hirsutella rhossiliensis TaxID=111463 RepID=A0A9P8MNC4_9HYPO|nr:FAD binding domain-containing protein [Hirsutella rhossiliensis]KAH0958179.1 FAD binding domain-containing protein [Hirsutella rhossiliensis]